MEEGKRDNKKINEIIRYTDTGRSIARGYQRKNENITGAGPKPDSPIVYRKKKTNSNNSKYKTKQDYTLSKVHEPRSYESFTPYAIFNIVLETK